MAKKRRFKKTPYPRPMTRADKIIIDKRQKRRRQWIKDNPA